MNANQKDAKNKNSKNNEFNFMKTKLPMKSACVKS